MKTFFRRCERFEPDVVFVADWCISNGDVGYIGPQGTFCDDVDDVIIHDVTDQKSFPAATNEPDVGFRRKLIKIKGRLSFLRFPESF